jgi:hypothetical protein
LRSLSASKEKADTRQSDIATSLAAAVEQFEDRMRRLIAQLQQINDVLLDAAQNISYIPMIDPDPAHLRHPPLPTRSSASYASLSADWLPARPSRRRRPALEPSRRPPALSLRMRLHNHRLASVTLVSTTHTGGRQSHLDFIRFFLLRVTYSWRSLIAQVDLGTANFLECPV